MDEKTMIAWMRAVEETIAEMAFAISQGKTLPTNADCFGIIEHGVREIRTLREQVQDAAALEAHMDRTYREEPW